MRKMLFSRKESTYGYEKLKKRSQTHSDTSYSLKRCATHDYSALLILDCSYVPSQELYWAPLHPVEAIVAFLLLAYLSLVE